LPVFWPLSSDVSKVTSTPFVSVFFRRRCGNLTLTPVADADVYSRLLLRPTKLNMSRFKHCDRVGGMPSILEILDTAGTEQFASMRDLYIKNGQGFIIVYSVTCMQTIYDIRSLRDNILRVKAGLLRQHLSYVRRPTPVRPPPIVLVGNKSDLAEIREVSPSLGQSLAREWNCPFIEVSARTGCGVNEAFLGIVRQVSLLSRFCKPCQPSPSILIQSEYLYALI
uniref:Small monomeric GTPase n=1 Tax=Schistocephalus solidus TaxID=70667 RepID=A0A183SXA4_SCHSO